MITSADAGRLAAAFGLAGPARLEGPVDRGELGQVWRLTTDAGTYAIKETFAELDDAAIATAHAFADRAAAAGVAVPRQLRSIDGRLALRDHGAPLRCYDWVDLHPTDRGLDAAAVGRTLAVLHRVGGPVDGPADPFFGAPVGAGRWDELITSVTVAGAPFAAAVGELRDSLLAAESIMTEPAATLLGHRDLFADNVRSGSAGVVVIDWDNCGPVDPVHELGFVLAEFGTTDRRVHTMISVYEAAGGPARLSGPSDFTMAVAVLHHLLEIDLQRWLDGSVHDRQRAESRVAEFVDTPFGVDEIAALLTIVAAT